ncbi:MAG: hypothetical protein NW224_07585 [Leptolyngbyaceae cyanobacterium bins.302]|nr:hypothetical protein [Leptolyngbyaceae cyanobacterium bins.302]
MPGDSFKKLSVKLLQWLASRLFPDWYYCQTWRYGQVEVTARQHLLERFKRTANLQFYRALISESRKDLLALFNREHSGFYLEDFIEQELSIRDFKQLYLILVTLLAVRLQINRAARFQDDIAALLPNEVAMTEKLIQGLEVRSGDEKEQALFAWDYILGVVGEDRIPASGLWQGCFVVFTGNTVKRLQHRWK